MIGEMGYEWTLHYMMGYVCSCISSSALHAMASKTMRNSGNKSWWVAKLTVVHTTLNQTNSTVAFGTNTRTVYTHTTLSGNYTDQGDKFTKSWVYVTNSYGTDQGQIRGTVYTKSGAKLHWATWQSTQNCEWTHKPEPKLQTKVIDIMPCVHNRWYWGICCSEYNPPIL